MATRLQNLINRMNETDPNWLNVTREQIRDGRITLDNVDETAEMDLAGLAGLGWDVARMPSASEVAEVLRAMVADPSIA